MLLPTLTATSQPHFAEAMRLAGVNELFGQGPHAVTVAAWSQQSDTAFSLRSH
ncbi:MAG TPA: hypothetical protein VIW67_13305 [Terriglobales bacterium]